MDRPAQIYRRAARACLGNASSLIGSAKALAKLDRFGHAASLLVIALEELGKGLELKLCDEGLAHVEGRGREKRVIHDFPFAGPVRLFGHSDKRRGPVALELVSSVVSLLGSFVRSPTIESGEKEIPIEDLEPKVAKRLAAKLETVRTHAREDAELLGKLDPLREAGFYVDFDDSQLTTPRDITKHEYLVAVRVVEGYRRMASRAITKGTLHSIIDDFAQSQRRTANKGRQR